MTEIKTTNNSNEWQDLAVLAERDSSGRLRASTFAFLSASRKLADRRGQKVSLILSGYQISEDAAPLFAAGANRIFFYDAPCFAGFQPRETSQILFDFLFNYKHSLLFAANSAFNKTLFLETRSRIQTALSLNCSISEIQTLDDLNAVQLDSCQPQLLLIDENLNLLPSQGYPQLGEQVFCQLPPELADYSMSLSVG